jgi:hypothetical protein
MSVSKRFTENTQNIQAVLGLYLGDVTRPTIASIAESLDTTFHNVQHIVKMHVPAETLKREQALRYSRSKMSEKNPMQGKCGEQHHNFIGLVEDGHGYLMRKVAGKYVLEHRRVLAEALGLSELPGGFDVHHINEDKQDNRLDNLALVTSSGHRALHAKWSPLQKLSLWELWESGTSKLKVTTLTSPTAS